MVLDITRVKLKFSQRTITNTCLIVTTNRKNEKNQLSSKIRAGRSFRESVCTKKENIFSQHSFHRCFVICQGKIIRSRTISSNRLTLLISKYFYLTFLKESSRFISGLSNPNLLPLDFIPSTTMEITPVNQTRPFRIFK